MVRGWEREESGLAGGGRAASKCTAGDAKPNFWIQVARCNPSTLMIQARSAADTRSTGCAFESALREVVQGPLEVAGS